MAFYPSCGKPVDDGAAFCPSCGYDLKTQPPTSPASLQPMAGGIARTAWPVGVTITAVLEGLAGFLELLGGAALLGVGTFMGRYGSILGVGLNMFLGVLGVFTLLVGLVTLFIAWGFWTGAGWAWTVGVVLTIVGAVLHLVTLPGSLVTLAINIIVLVYLFQPNMRRLLRPLNPATESAFMIALPALAPPAAMRPAFNGEHSRR